MSDVTPKASESLVAAPRWRRALRSGDPRGDDLREAQGWVKEIRSRLVHIRGELEDIGRIEAVSPHDSTCVNVAGALTLAISALYSLTNGERSFKDRAERTDELWADVAANPDDYEVRDGSTWKWQPWGIYKRGGRRV